MNKLDISNEILVPPYDSYCIDYLRAFMLLTEPVDRQRFIDTASAQFLAGNLGQIGPLRQSLDRAMGGDIWKFLAGAPAPSEWTVEKISPGFEGHLAGIVYGRAIHDYHADGKFYLTGIKDGLLEHLEQRGMRIKRSTLEAILARHKPCAHLWSAFAYQVEHGERAFPCTPASLIRFLASALWFQEWGLRIKPHRQGTLFDPVKLWRVPNDRLRLAIGTPFSLFDDLKIVRLPPKLTSPRPAWTRRL